MKRSWTLAILASLVFLLGCDKEDRYFLRFSHNVHVVDNGMECADCHGVLREGKFARPDHEACSSCHEDAVEAKEITRETCGTCHVEEDLGKIERADALSRGVFRHSQALQGDCAQCHGGLLEKKVEQVKVRSRADLVAIREKAHRWGRPCTDCHESLDAKIAPENHRRNWIRRHGVDASDEDAACTVCHSQENCRECHRIQRPSSHSNLWRLQTHAMEASWNRGRCQLCHQEDFCAGCHRDTRPRSHVADWRHRHCLNCHASVSLGIGCETCHPGGLAVHERIWPSFHNSFGKVDCLLCHK